MRHRKKTVKLNRTSSHRRAMLANMVSSLIKEEAIVTTRAKAKAAQPLAEKMVTRARSGSLAARRRAISILRDETAVKKLFDEIGPRFTDRPGGYTRILKMARPRRGDGAELARLAFLDEEGAPAPADDNKAKKAAPEKESK
ncbi:MAG: 50S ribosomal protein L17 [Candidatus Erginobacter occultus]|nr:50S ribosomal protein L17 [Candidatus Erginobacter occultus]